MQQVSLIDLESPSSAGSAVVLIDVPSIKHRSALLADVDSERLRKLWMFESARDLPAFFDEALTQAPH